MLDQEQDPSRCREIREIIRDIQSRRTTIVEQERNKRSQMTRLRSELSEKCARLDKLIKDGALVGIGATLSRTIGGIIGARSVEIAVEISNLQSQIRDLESQISSLEHDISKIQDEMDLLLRSEGENARKLSRLNCVSP